MFGRGEALTRDRFEGFRADLLGTFSLCETSAGYGSASAMVHSQVAADILTPTAPSASPHKQAHTEHTRIFGLRFLDLFVKSEGRAGSPNELV